MERLTLTIEGFDRNHIMDTLIELGHRGLFEQSGADETTEEPPARVAWTYGNADPAYVMIVRDPDAANQFTTWGDVKIIEFDMGSSFDGEPDDDETATGFVGGESGPTQLDGIPVDHPAYEAALSYYYEHCGDFDEARKILDAYDAKRRA